MAFGPCGGVTHEGTEVPGVGPCGYLAVPRSTWPYQDSATPAGDRPGSRSDGAVTFLRTAQRRPVLVTDLPAAALSAESLRACAGELAGATDACLLGDHGPARVQLPPSYRTRLLADEGSERATARDLAHIGRTLIAEVRA
jgi:methylenetetrahydrofolate reductase (NADPH)